MMMYFIIEKALDQIPSSTDKETPKDPRVGSQLLPGWNCQNLQFPSKSIKLPTPWAKPLVMQKQANLWLMHEAEQSHSAWEQTWLCRAGRKRNEWWSLGLAQAFREHTRVLREQCLLQWDVVPQPHFCRLRGSPEGCLWKRRNLWILCGRKTKYGIFEKIEKRREKIICCYVRSHKALLEEFLKKRLCLLGRGSKESRPTILLSSLVF